MQDTTCIPVERNMLRFFDLQVEAFTWWAETTAPSSQCTPTTCARDTPLGMAKTVSRLNGPRTPLFENDNPCPTGLNLNGVCTNNWTGPLLTQYSKYPYYLIDKNTWDIHSIRLFKKRTLELSTLSILIIQSENLGNT